MIIGESGLVEAGVPVSAAGSHKRKKILSRISASLFKGRAHKAGSERLRCVMCAPGPLLRACPRA